MAEPIKPNIWYEMEAKDAEGYSVDVQVVNKDGKVAWHKTVTVPRIKDAATVKASVWRK